MLKLKVSVQPSNRFQLTMPTRKVRARFSLLASVHGDFFTDCLGAKGLTLHLIARWFEEFLKDLSIIDTLSFGELFWFGSYFPRGENGIISTRKSRNVMPNYAIILAAWQYPYEIRSAYLRAVDLCWSMSPSSVGFISPEKHRNG